jgi:hypothetical protein
MSRAAGAVLVVAAVALTIWRAPQYVVAPSFWAEEGMLYFAQAWNAGPWAGLVQRSADAAQIWPRGWKMILRREP